MKLQVTRLQVCEVTGYKVAGLWSYRLQGCRFVKLQVTRLQACKITGYKVAGL